MYGMSFGTDAPSFKGLTSILMNTRIRNNIVRRPTRWLNSYFNHISKFLAFHFAGTPASKAQSYTVSVTLRPKK